MGKQKKVRQKRKLSPKVMRITIAVWAILIIGLLIFAEVVRPNQDASGYTTRLNDASKPLEACFTKLSETTQLPIYYAPDVVLKDKQTDIATIRKQIAACRQQLASFNASAHKLMDFRFAGYTTSYKAAKVNQRQAYDVVGQSTDVMDQYDRLASFLSAYYDHISAFQDYTASLSKLNTYYITNSNGKALASQADDLRARADDIRKLDAPAEFETTKQATADMFTKAATGFDNVAYGYTNAADYYTTIGFSQVDAATKSFDSTIVNMPFEQLIASYVPKQVQQLPGKVVDLLAAQSE